MIVRNKILIDVQGEDVLMQIFTGLVMQREAGREAPFLEFIQRLCADGGGGAASEPAKKKAKSVSGAAAVVGGGGGGGGEGGMQGRGDVASEPIRPGCGGFGIRNFLTLFLSIEVSKAMAARGAAKAEGDGAGEAFHARRVELFTEQLVEANPILNEISDSMTAEGKAVACNDAAALALHTAAKEAANGKLQTCAAKYNALMKAHRESHDAATSAAAFAKTT
jgi:hypothetical protein